MVHKMNDRIKQLAVQAGLIAPYASDREGLVDFDYRKFAELIVRECAKVILETPVDYMETDTMHRIRDSVKQHFGVEELPTLK